MCLFHILLHYTGWTLRSLVQFHIWIRSYYNWKQTMIHSGIHPYKKNDKQNILIRTFSEKMCLHLWNKIFFFNHNIRKMRDIFINWKPNVEINVLFEVLKLLVPENVIFLPLGHFLIVLFFDFSESPTSIAYRKKIWNNNNNNKYIYVFQLLYDYIFFILFNETYQMTKAMIKRTSRVEQITTGFIQSGDLLDIFNCWTVNQRQKI